MTTPEPLDPDELASAHLDGATTPAQAALVEADPALEARVAELAAVRALVAAAGSSTEAEASREPAVAAALAAFDDLGVGDRDADAPAAGQPRSLATAAARRGRAEGRSPWLVAAAAVAAAALAVPLVAQLADDGSTGDGEQLALDDSATTLESGADSMAGSAAEEAAPQDSTDPDATRGGAATTDAALGPVEWGAFADLAALEQAVRARSDAGGHEGSNQAAYEDPASTTSTPPACVPPLETVRPPEGAVPQLVGRATVAGASVLVDVYGLPDGGRYLVVVDAATCALVGAERIPPTGP